MIGMTVCSGIGAPEVSAPWIDWRYQSEIERFPCAVLAHRFPSAVNLGDMTKFQEWPDAVVDVLAGGTPCQSFSVAGLRKGLADPRGNLMLTFLAIARRYRPRWLVWENVPGVLSSNEGRDFGAFLRGVGECGYGWSYRVLDAQYVRTSGFPCAVPQRRRRVFVVGYFGDWRPAAAVLFEPEGMRGHPAPRRKAGQIAPTIPSRSTGGGGLGTDFDCDGGLIASTGDVAHCLNAGAMGRIDYESETMIAHALRGEGFDASEDGTGRGTPLVPVAVEPVAGTMKACKESGGWSNSADHAAAGYMLPVAIQERAVSENPDHGPQGAGYRTDGAANTLEARNTVQAVAFGLELSNQGSGGNVGWHDLSKPARTLDTGSSPLGIATPYAVRRLTPIECERLQGFPDGWTQIPYRGKPADACPDGPRYKALGNSWAINCGQFIFDRIKAVEEIMQETAV